MNVVATSIKRLVSYFRDVREEMQKVTWPSKQQATRYSLIVVGVSTIVAIFFIVLDQLFNLGLEQLLSI
ncbi:MAG: preprotein translocase subunit SecE [Patescibacteria group bacterium]